MVLYILSISFQLAGALVLIIHYWKNAKKLLELSIFSFTSPDRNKEEKIVVPKEILQQRAYPIYLNRIAFTYIAIGYLLGIFCHSLHMNIFCVFASIVIISLLLMFIGRFITKVIINSKYKQDETYEDEYIEKNYSGVPLIAKDSEIEEIKSIFK